MSDNTMFRDYLGFEIFGNFSYICWVLSKRTFNYFYDFKNQKKQALNVLMVRYSAPLAVTEKLVEGMKVAFQAEAPAVSQTNKENTV